MRNRAGAVAGSVLIAVLILAACSGSTAHGTAPKKTPSCALVTRLDDIANNVAHADVSDPDGFNRQFKAAVDQYVTTVKELRAAAPANLDASLDRVAADVQQYRFADALADRADLDAYAKTACNRTVVSVVLAPPSTAAPSVPTTAVPFGVTTTAPADTTVSSTIAG